MRDQQWLEKLVETIWVQHFPEVERKSDFIVKFGKRARTRLGSLSYNYHTHEVTLRITALFKDPEVPDMVVKATIVHELCHYAHGWHSGLETKFKYPHAGGVIAREFAERGLEDLYIEQKKWLKTEWPKFIRANFGPLRARSSRSKIIKRLW